MYVFKWIKNPKLNIKFLLNKNNNNQKHIKKKYVFLNLIAVKVK